jgi:hypothetical protein
MGSDPIFVDTVVLGPQRKIPYQEIGGFFFVDLSIVGNNTVRKPLLLHSTDILDTKEFWWIIPCGATSLLERKPFRNKAKISGVRFSYGCCFQR